MTRPLLSLVMMVKDEAASIAKVLEAAKPHIDRWTIVDTGSTDATRDLILKTLEGVPGHLYCAPWLGYAATRNLVLGLNAGLVRLDDEGEQQPARPTGDEAVFSLFLSGDEYLRDGKALRKHLEAHRDANPIEPGGPLIDCHFVCVYVDDAMTPQGRVFRTGSQWHYQDGDCGVHEFPAHPDGQKALLAAVPHTSIEHIVSDVEGRFATIEEKHIPLLEAALERNPQNARALMLMAQSYECLFPFFSPEVRVSYAMLAMSFYLRRSALPGTPEELNYARMHYYDNARIAGVYTDPELYARLVELQKADPGRPEVALMLLETSFRVLPMPQAYEVAVHAAQVAEAAKSGIGNTSTVSTSVGWQAHRYAAMIARQLVAKGGADKEKWSKRVKEHISAGMTAGGAWAAFKPLTEAYKKPEPGQDTKTSTKTPPDAPSAA